MEQLKRIETDRPDEQQGQNKEPCFINILQNPQTQAVMSLGNYSLGEIIQQPKDNTTQITKYSNIGNNVYMNELVAKDMDSATLKIYLLLQQAMAKDFNADLVSVNINNYMKDTGIQKRSNAWKHLEHAGKVFMNTAVEGIIYSKNKKDNIETKIQIPICIGADRRRNKKKKVRADVFNFIPSTDYKNLCQYSGYFAPIHKNILKLPNNRPIAIRFAYKMCVHYNINKPKGYSNSNTIKVKTLLEACQDIPPYETVGRQYKQRIIKPVDENLEALVDYKVLKEFTYRGKNGAILTIADCNDKTFEEFAECNVLFTFTEEFAEETKEQLAQAGKLIEKRAKAKEKREERRENKIAEAIAKQRLKAEQKATE